MAQFFYIAKKGPGKTVQGAMRAETRESAVDKLIFQGLVPVSISAVKKQTEAAKNVNAPVGRRPALRLGQAQINIFTRQLSNLVKANIPILKALSLISSQDTNRTVQFLAGELASRINDGETLSEAMSAYPEIFDDLYLTMVLSGEQGGILDEMLESLAGYREKEAELKRGIQSSLAYPCLVMLVGAATIFVAAAFFMPRLLHVFSGMDEALPLPTVVLMEITGFMSRNRMWFVLGALFLSALFFRSKAGSKKKMVIDAFKLNIPYVKTLIKHSEIEKFARTLKFLMRSGLPVYKSFELTSATVQNEILRAQLDSSLFAMLHKGGGLSEVLSKRKIFPPYVVGMIQVGEESGRLEEALSQVQEYYENDISGRLKVIMSLLEPVLILVVGSIVAFIAFAMLLPIFTMQPVF